MFDDGKDGNVILLAATTTTEVKIEKATGEQKLSPLDEKCVLRDRNPQVKSA